MTVYRPFTEKLGASDPTTFIGNAGELFYNADTQQVFISDGSTPGGIPIAGGGGVQSSITDGTSTLSFDSNNRISIDTHIIPDTNAAYDLGNAEYKIRHLFLSDNSLTMGDTTLSEQNIIRSVEIGDEPAPNVPNEPGRKGDIRISPEHLYICVEENQWRRVSLDPAWV
ncbi:MAG: hypothetical protein CMP21_03965 [Rickettsiales bacterium]|nr:hypothetical protein [Rickettsiales bacterium]|tara:strand:- start:4863 stop:5369 length:507 start_codon:yes stop_codon:yes gene_type:complete